MRTTGLIVARVVSTLQTYLTLYYCIRTQIRNDHKFIAGFSWFAGKEED